MRIDLLLSSIGALVASSLLTGVARRLALANGLLDLPNARSSHHVATPRGGGMAVALVVIAACGILFALGRMQSGLFMAIEVGGTAVAVVGFLDDRRGLPPAIRLAVHLAAALSAIAFVGAPESLLVGGHEIELGWGGFILGAVGIVWMLNLFNFMDGIDGIAASESVFIAAGSALCVSLTVGASGLVEVALIVGAASLGFLLWNWPPAKIFMGDVGSGFLGYIFGVLIVTASRSDAAAIWWWLTLGGVFLVDATVTLLHRAARGERLHQAHRSHAYQRLARQWGSHRRVTIAATLINVLWLLPCSLFSVYFPSWGMWAAAAALTPLFAVAIALGAGRRSGDVHS